MRHFTKLLTSLSLVMLGALLFASSAAAQNAKILKKIGAGTATFTPLNGTATAADEGVSVPLGATIETGANVELYIEAVTGAIATIKANSVVLVEALTADNAVLDLKRGAVVSQIDRTRIGNNNYGVRTPRGVAAARGTIYTVVSDGITYTVTTFEGRVTIVPVVVAGQPTPPAIEIGPGGVKVGDADAVDASTLAAGSDAANALNNAASIALAAIAVVAGDPNLNQGSNTAAGELGSVLTLLTEKAPNTVANAVSSAAAASPSQADEVVTAAVNAATAAGQDTATAVKSITNAAATGAASTATSTEQLNTLAADIARAGADAGVTTTTTAEQAAAIVSAAASGTAQGTNNGAKINQSGISGDSQAIANNAANGAAQGGSIGASNELATTLAGAASGGAVEGSGNAGVSVDSTVVTTNAAAGASTGSGTSVLDTNVVLPQPSTNIVVPDQPVITPVNPDDVTVVSPSN